MHIDYRFYKAVKSPSTVIVMEDLNASGYIMRSSSNRLNLSDSRAVLSRLAKFHAASAVYTKQVGNNFPTLDMNHESFKIISLILE